MKLLQKIFFLLCVFVYLLVSLVGTSNVRAISACDKKAIEVGSIYTDNDLCEKQCSTESIPTTTTADGSVIDKFMRSLAYHESRGKPDARNGGSSASGKYQYITSTWKSVSTVLSGASSYPTMADAPESVQDAVEYLSVVKQLKENDADITKILSIQYIGTPNYESKWDTVPGSGNTETVGQYITKIIGEINNPPADVAKIQLSYNQAPKFSEALAAVGEVPKDIKASKGGPLTGTTNSQQSTPTQTSTTANTPAAGTNKPTYGSGPRLKSGLPDGANVTLEDWAKLMLKFVANGAGAKESDVITDQKVMAVVGWQLAEGGSTVTPGSYNGLNVAKDNPKLQADLNPVYNHVYADGNQHPAFKNLDQGVESNVRFIEKDHYSRLRTMLLDPTLTADKFVQNFDNKSYNGATGQLTWAAGGYLDNFNKIIKGFEGNPAAKQRAYSTPILGDRSKQALKAMGVTPQDNITKLDITAVKAGGATISSTCSDSSNSPSGKAVGNLLFPLQIGKSAFKTSNGNCVDDGTQSICKAGHPYTAYDLMAPEKTPVVAAKDGVVVSAKLGTCGHGFGSAFTVQIFNKDEGRTYFYQHMDAASGKVQKGDTVTAGTTLGVVGGAAADCNTATHLHFDVSNSDHRAPCSRLSCSADVKAKFVDVSKELYLAYTGLQ